ncbi:MAG: two-partner secretion domain-containing protein [Acetobacter sp.]|uniref:two-partner secretion domain-containing protein n=1 Tax=Acetobacter sp. TaxID=440 RepID=UPI003F92A9ED
MNRFFRRVVATGTSFSLALAPTLANAQQAAPSIVIDNRTNPAAPAPSLDRTANGVQQLNIATPNGVGLSHNMFTQYGVEQKGLILNNATQATQTKLGGYVYGNANLHGKAANVILNEVTGQQASQMLGYTEVAGQKANVIIANPNGITCNGCGFINTDRLSLSTGHPEIDASGKLSALTVSDGLIAFEGKGGDFTAVPVLDILSRRVTLNARVNAQTARLVVGRSRFDYETGTVHALKSDGSKTPEFAIDSSALGGMYAGQISMLVTEAGAGVRVNGTMASNAGDMTLTADGRLVLNGIMSASGSMAVQAAGVDNAGTLQSGADTRLASTADIQNTGAVSAGQGLRVNGSSLANTGSMTAAGRSGATFTLAGSASNSGKIGADQGGLALTAASLTMATNSTLASTGSMTVQAGQSVSNAGQISTSSGKLALTTGAFANHAGGLVASGGDLAVSTGSYAGDAGASLKSDSALSLISTGAVENNGAVAAGTSLTVTAASGLSNGQSGNLTAAAGPLAITAQGSGVNNIGNIGTVKAGDLTLDTTTLSNSGTLTAMGNGSVQAQGSLTNSGSLTVSGDTLQVSTSTLQNSGILAAYSGSLAVQSSGALANSGTLYGATTAALSAADALTNTGGQIGSGTGLLRLSASDLFNGAGGRMISQSGGVSLVAQSVDNRDGAIQGQGDVSLSAKTLDNRNGGSVVSLGGSLSLSQGNAPIESVLNQGGALGAADSLSLNTNSYESDASSALVSTGVLTLVMSGVLDNGGTLSGDKGFNLTVGGFRNESSGILAARTGDGQLTIKGNGSLTNAGMIETLASGSQLSLSSSGSLENTGSVLGSGSVTVAAADAVTNSGKLSALGGDLTLSAGSLNNSATLAAVGSVSIGLNGDLDNTGLLYGADSVALVAGGAIRNAAVAGAASGTTGGIGSGSGSLSILATSLDNSASGAIVASQGAAQVYAGTLANSAVLQGNTGLAVFADTLVNGSTGQMVSQAGDLSVAGLSGSAVASMTNAGIMQAQTALALQSDVLDNTHGTLVAQTGPVVLAVNGVLKNSAGMIQSAQDMRVTAASYASDVASVLHAGQALTATFSDAVDNAGHMIAGGPLSLSAGSLTTHGATNPDDVAVIASTGSNVSITAGVIHNAGSLQAAGTSGQTLTINATSLDNTGVVSARGDLGLTLSGDLASSGSLVAQKGAATVTRRRLRTAAFWGALRLSI